METHPVPAMRPTNCTFGDPDLNTLYVTTGGGPGGGQLLRVRNTGRRGWPIYPL
jgi:sugar lactone lactonase YvrE